MSGDLKRLCKKWHSYFICVGRFSNEVAVSIAIGVGVALLAIALVAVVVLGIYVSCLLYRRKTRAGKHEPLVAAERGRKRDEKERKRKT